jgi:Protein of unknown function (DUF3644)
MVVSSRSEALNAVEFYNRPGGRRPLETFLVHLHVAWLYLLQAQFLRDSIDFHYRDPKNPRRYVRVDGEKKAWDLEKCVRQRWPDAGDMRLQSEVVEAEQEYFDRVWYSRSRGGRVGGPYDPVDSYEPKLRATVLAARARIEAQYGKETLESLNAFEHGMINGKLSALRWVLGDDWDFLDT